MENLVEMMVSRGWSKEEIDHTLGLLHQHKERDHRMKENLNRFVYWTSLLVIALTNFIGSFLLIPFFFLFDGWQLLLFVVLFGLLFGTLFNFLIMGIEQLEWHHHAFAAVLIPLLIVIDVKIMMNFTEAIGQELNLVFDFRTKTIILIFIFSFILPYLSSIIAGRHSIYKPVRKPNIIAAPAEPPERKEPEKPTLPTRPSRRKRKRKGKK